MKSSRVRRAGGFAALLVLTAAGLLAAGIVGGNAPAATSQRLSAETPGSIHLRFNLDRVQLNKKQNGLLARGTAVATYSAGGVKQTETQHVTLAVGQNSTCRVLHLELGELKLNLLGLIVSLTPVDDPNIVIDISADSSEALGKLLCQLISSLQSTSTAPSTTAAKLTATHRVNQLIHDRYSSGVMSVNVPLKSNQQQAQTTTTTTASGTTTTSGGAAGQCEVLNLLLGPLNLDLLGLVVTVNKIDLDISANPVGTLGTLFCQLAGTTSTPTISLPGTTALAPTG